MVDPYLIVVVLVMMLVLGIINLYLLAHYSHPLESKFGGSIFAKIIIIVALLLAEGEILLLPLDVSNVQNDAGLDMKNFWYAMTMTSAIFIFFILPISMFYYESEGDELKSRIWHATKMEFLFLVISSVIVFATYGGLSKTNVPIKDIKCDMTVAVDNGVLSVLDSTMISDD